ncbi:pyruvate kinase [Clostridium botulinum]|uniref:Pyruvate kinase n=2 Tax=Clostridium botulinum TaxID=1491 RepID=A0A846HXJ1_CLOBO|nr:pyruvate kinase [Clostridium botulinum]ACQ52775.1 pyruvate kinase [Clostridium botulinum Ba4 str. 657]AJE12607.1 pyruvate kinase [Clostridium botulinum CDC_1436]APU58623.1 pyruvate kinase [Clostridium botulinum]AXG93023.1 pyruvate kinase [Clostridium botulinum]EDT86820.1 pyruvate kinase [Clostridium botulinum Bf]
MQKTKMIFTIGPASSTEEIVSKLIEAGMSVSRHNFSHGSHPEHKERMMMIKKLREKHNKHIAIMLDTKGPEIRTGNFSVDKVELKEGAEFTIYCREDIIGDETKCSITYDELYKDVVKGNKILIDDGLVELEVQSVEDNKIHTVVKNSGTVSNHKGVNVPGVSVSLPAVTEKDIEDLKFGCEVGVDLISASFIRKASDVLAIRKILEENGGNEIQIISKIENQEGVDNIDEIIKFSDGIMVARGDMGVEIPIEEVPIVQKRIIEKCNKAGKPVITATQMLDSMMRNPRPTRAEASDIANAIFDGTDAIMLSGESANGKYPVEAARTMSRIAKTAEAKLNYDAILNKMRESHILNVPNAISLSACTTASELNATAIITATQSGHTAKMVSKYRPQCPIIAVTPNEIVARKLALNWGVVPLLTETFNSTDELIDKSVNKSLEEGYVKNGDLVVIAGGIPVSYSGTTNMLKVHIVGDILSQGRGSGTRPTYGNVKVVKNPAEAEDIVERDDILVVKNLDRRYITILDRVSGIVAEEGGITSHLAIECIARDIPFICNAGGAMDVLKTGTYVTLDTVRGIVYNGRANIV